MEERVVLHWVCWWWLQKGPEPWTEIPGGSRVCSMCSVQPCPGGAQVFMPPNSTRLNGFTQGPAVQRCRAGALARCLHAYHTRRTVSANAPAARVPKASGGRSAGAVSSGTRLRFSACPVLCPAPDHSYWRQPGTCLKKHLNLCWTRPAGGLR